MAIKFSPLQEKAIKDSGMSILVNAGAGSGKTAVLAERLLQKILKGVKLKNLIVVTFTKLAASEMKERLRSLMLQNLSTYPHLLEELNYIDQANIQTFDAFCNEIVKKYHYRIGLKKDFNIVSDKFFKGIVSNILDEILNELYEKKDSDFIELVNKYTVKDDLKLRSDIIKMHEAAQNNMMKFEDVSPSDVVKRYCDYVNDEKKSLMPLYNNLLKYRFSLTENIFLYIDSLMNDINNTTSYDDLKGILQSTKYPQMTRKDFDGKDEFKVALDSFKKKVISYKELFSYSDEMEIECKYSESHKYKKLLESIIIEIENRLNDYKEKTSTFNFSDIARYAIKVFEENDDIRLKYKNSINEILIDEYQDTSPIQENLMKLISNNNMYMVGDVKQSIYRFRKADPNIFTNTYHDLSSGSGEVIDLNSNYRSSNNVISTVNEIFKDLMNREVGGIDYDLSQHLGFGFKKYLSGPNNSELQTSILEYFPKDTKFKSHEIEAFIIANDIKNKLGVIQVYDKSNDSFRPVKYSDFAILTHSKKKFDEYNKIFDYLNIPINTFKEESISSSQMFIVLSNLLKVVYYFDKAYDVTNNSKHLFRYSLISVLRSYIFSFSDSKIHTILYSNDVLKELEKECNDIYNKFKELNKIKDYSNVCDIFDMLTENFNIYENISSLDGVLKEEAIINNFRKVLIDIDKLGYDFKEAIDYVDDMINLNSFDAKIIDESQTNCVKMLSIHASKGLEYPICYFPELGANFNLSEFKDKFLYSSIYGVIVPFIYDDKLNTNVCKVLYKKEYHKEEVSEKIRLFYVALTRAREQIVIVTPQMEKLESSNYARSKYTNFYELLCSVDINFNNYIKSIDVSNMNISLDYKKKANINLEVDELSDETKKEINSTFKVYNNTLNTNTITKLHPSKERIQIATSSEIKLMEIGTLFHKALEFVNIKLTQTHKESYVNDFLNSSLINELRSEGITNDYHELKFAYFDYKNNEISGIIDLVIETNNRLVVIDYKLSNIDDPNYDKQVNVYVDYLKQVSNKPIEGYLYSINKKVFRKV